MFERFDLRNVVTDHFSTFRDYRTDKIQPVQIVVSVLIPVLIAVLVGPVAGVELDSGSSNVLVTSLSIFSALLLNLLLLMYDIVERGKENRELSRDLNQLKQQVLTTTFKNISFSILVAVTAIVLLLISYMDLEFGSFALNSALEVIIYFLVSLFIMTLYMILRRVHILLLREIKREEEASSQQ